MSKYLFSLLILCSTPCFAASPYSIDLSAGIVSDDNITNGRDNKDIEDDTIISADVRINHNLALNATSGLTTHASLGLEQYQDFDKLSNTDLSAGIEYRIQPDMHFTAPWFSLSLTLGMRDYDSAFRDGTYNEIGASIGKRFTDKVTVIAGYSRYSGDADNNLFDVDHNRLYINTDLKTGPSNTLYLTLQRISGDIISTNVPPHPQALDSITWIDDDAYPSLSFPWTYRLDADTTAIQLGDHFTFDSKQTIDVSISLYDSDAYGNFSYERTIISLYYLYRF